jgi:hypothetical protein
LLYQKGGNIGLFKDIKEGVKKVLHREGTTDERKEKVKFPNENHKYEPGKNDTTDIPGTYDTKSEEVGKQVFEKTGTLREGVGQSSTLKPRKYQLKPIKVFPEGNL